MDVATIIGIALAAAFALVAVAEWTGGSRRKVAEFEAREAAKVAAGNNDTPLARVRPVIAEVPEGYRPGTHLQRLVSPQGFLGIIFVPLLVFALLGNAYVTADAFAVALDRVPEPLFRVGELEITNFYLLGLLLSVALLILSGVLAETHRSQWVLLVLALLGIGSIFTIEYWAAWERGTQLAAAAGIDATSTCVINLGIAVGTSILETLAGFYTIHLMLLPAALAVACAVGALCRWAALGLRLLVFHLSAPRSGMGVLTRIGAALDAMFEPLRALDRAIAGWWQRRSGSERRAVEG